MSSSVWQWNDGYLRGQVQSKSALINNLMSDVRALKEKHPGLKQYLPPKDARCVLHAYREGDLSFDEALARLEEISGRKASEATK